MDGRHLSNSLAVLQQQSYYHGHISRAEAERRVRREGLYEGLFLVRSKDPSRDAYVLTAVTNGRLQHHSIRVSSARIHACLRACMHACLSVCLSVCLFGIYFFQLSCIHAFSTFIVPAALLCLALSAWPFIS